jgi:hypothetical protein
MLNLAARLVSTDALARHFAAGASVAAKWLKYEHVSQLILDDMLGPERVLRLFSSSASKTWKRDAALVLLSGSAARYRAHRESWTPEPAARLARDLVGDAFGFGAVSNAATRLVRESWARITELANDEARAA